MSAVTTTGIGVSGALALIIAPWGVVVDEAPVWSESAWTVFSEEAFQAGIGTSTGKFVEKTNAAADLSALVASLKAESGLTADQLGRLMGVSRRSIHNWAAGSSIASVHEERLRELDSLISSLPGESPEERRSALLDSSQGPSLFKQFASKADAPQRIKFGVPVEERLGL